MSADTPQNSVIKFSDMATGMRANAIRDLLKLLENPEILSFAGGIPDTKLFPREKLAEISADVIRETKTDALQYSVTPGLDRLRELIAERMKKRGVPCGPENIIITTGSQQAVDILARVLLRGDDNILVEDPSYLGALQTFKSHGADIAVLGDNEADEDHTSFAYVVPDHANPTGHSMSLENRKHLLERARLKDFAIVEDAAYAELTYPGTEEIPSILALDCEETGSIETSRVVYCGTFSKTMVPAFRIGWICASQETVKMVGRLKECNDLMTGAFNQQIMVKVMESFYDEHVQTLRETYGRRRDAMQDALTQYMPEGVTWEKPGGGMFFWLTLPEHIDGEEILKGAIEHAKIAFVPGHNFRVDQSVRNIIRMSFCTYERTVIDVAMKRFGEYLKSL